MNEECAHRATTTRKKCSNCKKYTDLDEVKIEDIMKNIDSLYNCKYDDFSALCQHHNIHNNQLVLDAILIKLFLGQEDIDKDTFWSEEIDCKMKKSF